MANGFVALHVGAGDFLAAQATRTKGFRIEAIAKGNALYSLS